jgi:predicted DNA-binding transcriptional regulator AlpA
MKKRFHLDRRAAGLITIGRAQFDEDQLISTKQWANWTGTSTQLWEIARWKGEGPKWIKISPRRVRYRVGDLLEWLESRTCSPVEG